MSSAMLTSVGAANHSDQGTCRARLAQAEYGSLDLAKLDRLGELLAYLATRGKNTRLVLDLSNVQYFGAGFMGVLVDASHHLARAGRRLVLCGLTPQCASLIRVMHLEKVFNVVELPQSAVDGPAEPDLSEKFRPLRVRLNEVARNSEMVVEALIGPDCR